MKKKISAFVLFFLLSLVLFSQFSLALISKLEARPIANGIIRITYTIDNTSNIRNFGLYRDTLAVKQGVISSNPFYDIYDDLDTQNAKTYSYVLKIYDKNGDVVQEKNTQATADSQPPSVISERKILSKSNVLMIKTDEDSFCKAGFSLGNLVAMDGRTKQHTVRLGMVEGLNMIYVLCEDTYANVMVNPKLIEYTYDSKAPGQIKEVDVLNNLPTQVLISWSPATDAHGIREYRVYKLFGEKETYLGQATSNSFTDTKGLREGQSYGYLISAVDNAGNEGIKSEPKYIKIYNTGVLLSINKEFSTKTGDVIVEGTTAKNADVTATFESKVQNTQADENGNFSFSFNTDHSMRGTIEAIDENGSSKLAIVAITRLSPEPEIQNMVQIREQKTDYKYIVIIAAIFVFVLALIFFTFKKATLYEDIDDYIKKRKKNN